ncbi:MAG: PTS sugar transporter subunit IIA [Desulfobacteraceae bacterium]|nr:PTS sugar transporter subunit IIA [Desulfobacteraceae bacterium]
MELTIQEFCKCLDMPLNTIERWIRQGRIPVKRVENKCIFNDTALRKWAEEHNLHYHPPGEMQTENSSEKLVTLTEAVESGGIYYDISGDTVEEVLAAAVWRMESIESEEDRKVLYNSLIAREQMMSTGVGNGVAIPHPRTPLDREGIPTQIATFFLEKPVDYRAVDRKPVYVLFILVSKTSKQHLHVLSRISYCLRDNVFLQMLSETPDSQTLKGKIREFDAILNGSG